ncbi:MAG: hypothetical protein GXO75_05290 [Calditrichaeota bacterium]|nr:hypothetical protein [Calditrichota bacterium]
MQNGNGSGCPAELFIVGSEGLYRLPCTVNLLFFSGYTVKPFLILIIKTEMKPSVAEFFLRGAVSFNELLSTEFATRGMNRSVRMSVASASSWGVARPLNRNVSPPISLGKRHRCYMT